MTVIGVLGKTISKPIGAIGCSEASFVSMFEKWKTDCKMGSKSVVLFETILMQLKIVNFGPQLTSRFPIKLCLASSSIHILIHNCNNNENILAKSSTQ